MSATLLSSRKTVWPASVFSFIDCKARSIASETRSCSVAVRFVSVDRVVPQPAWTNVKRASAAATEYVLGNQSMGTKTRGQDRRWRAHPKACYHNNPQKRRAGL